MEKTDMTNFEQSDSMRSGSESSTVSQIANWVLDQMKELRNTTVTDQSSPTAVVLDSLVIEPLSALTDALGPSSQTVESPTNDVVDPSLPNSDSPAMVPIASVLADSPAAVLYDSATAALDDSIAAGEQLADLLGILAGAVSGTPESSFLPRISELRNAPLYNRATTDTTPTPCTNTCASRCPPCGSPPPPPPPPPTLPRPTQPTPCVP